MAEFELWFVRSSTTELVKTVFSRSGKDTPLVSLRGKTQGAYGGAHSFQWTAAVRAMAQLALRTKITSGDAPVVIEGERGSLVSSLDYALGKKPLWLAEMFGTDPEGEPFALRLFKRSNPEQKRPGPIAISFNRALLPPTAMKIYVDSTYSEDPRVIGELLQALIADNPESAEKAADGSSTAEALDKVSAAKLPGLEEAYPAPFHRTEVREGFREAIQKEVREMLSDAYVFSADEQAATMKELATLPWLRAALKRYGTLAGVVDRKLSAAERLGCFDNPALRARVAGNRPIRVAVPPTMVASVAIFLSLKHIHGLPIELEFHYGTSYDIVDAVRKAGSGAPPDLAALTLGSVADTVRSKTPFPMSPFIMLPRISHGIVGVKPAVEPPPGEPQSFSYALWNATPSGAKIYFDRLCAAGAINPKPTQVEHASPDTVAARIAGGDSSMRAGLWFPYYYLLGTLPGCYIVEAPPGVSARTEQVLFAHEAITQDTELALALNVAIRNAWLDLGERPDLIQRVAQAMVDSGEFLKMIARVGGLRHLRRA